MPSKQTSIPHKRVKQYLIGNTIGKGSFATVKEALDENTKQVVALKICKKKALRRIPSGLELVKQEIHLLEGLNHPNVVHMHEHWYDEDNEKLYTVLDYAGGGSLDMYRTDHTFSEEEARKVFTQLIEGLQYLHSKGIIHCDVKPDNLLLTSDGDLQIIDFTVAKVSSPIERSDSYSSEESESSEWSSVGQPKCGAGQGAVAFQPPEVINGEVKFSAAGKSLDLWAAGLVLFMIVVGNYPFYKEDGVASLLDNIAHKEVPIPEGLSGPLSDLLSKMLSRDRSKRLSIAEIKKHKWMQGDVEDVKIKPLASVFVKRHNGTYKVHNSHSRECTLL